MDAFVVFEVPGIDLDLYNFFLEQDLKASSPSWILQSHRFDTDYWEIRPVAMKLNGTFAIIAILCAGVIAVPTACHNDPDQQFLPAYSEPSKCDEAATNPCPKNDDLCCSEERTCVSFAGGLLLCFKRRRDEDLDEVI